ncbi:MAG: hypothetical protein JST86_07165 [Bacteroidetes bacterium]|nr:hypothetical protein [Bacteroidota bacterium]
MKKFIVAVLCASFLLSGCFVTNLFRKKEKYGCPSDGRNVGAEKILAGEKVKKAKYRGGKKSVGE